MKHSAAYKGTLLADQAIVSGGTLATQLLVASGLGIAPYGRFSALVLLQLFLLSIQQAGITGMYQVIYPDMNGGMRARYAAGVWGLESMFLAGITIVALCGFPFFRTQYSFMEWMLCLSNVLLFLLQDFLRRIFIMGNETKYLVITDLLNNLLQVAALTVLLFAHSHSLVAVLWACSISYIPGMLWSLMRRTPRPDFGEVPYVFRRNGAEAAWMTASALLQWFAGNFYILAAGWWLGAAALGILRLGQYAFGVLNVVLQAVESYLLPRSAARASAPGELVRYLRTAQYKILLGTGLLLLLVMLCSKPLISWLDIPHPGELTTVLYGMSVLYLFVAGGYPIRIALRTLKLSRFFFTGYVLSAAFGFSTAYVFIHQWNLAGVIAGLLCSQVLLLCYWVCILQHKYAVLWK